VAELIRVSSQVGGVRIIWYQSEGSNQVLLIRFLFCPCRLLISRSVFSFMIVILLGFSDLFSRC